MKRTIDGAVLVTALKYTIDHEGVLKDSTYIKIAKSMFDFYDKSGFLTGKQIEFLSRILESCDVPDNLSLLPFREPVVNKSLVKPVLFNRATLERDLVKITFRYDPDIIALVKTLSGRRYRKAQKEWVAPLSYKTIDKLVEWGFKLSPSLNKWYKEQVNPDDIHITEIPGLKIPLMPFQMECVEFLEKKKGCALLAGEMGTGKTAQALAYLQLHPELRPAIIVCPASLKYNWQNEVSKFMDGKDTVQIINGRDVDQELHGDILIINYDILSDVTEKDPFRKGKRLVVPESGWWSYLVKYKAKVLVLDEIHFCKSNKSLRSEACRAVASTVPHVIGLSGTPILNRPCEIHLPISMINKFLFPAFFKFAMEFCGAWKSQWGWNFDGATNIPRLNKILTENVMIRHLKKDVLKELPDKMHTIIPIQIDNMSEYRKVENDFISYLHSFDSEKAQRAERAEQLARVEFLKQLSVEGKITQVISWIKNFLESGEKLVVFALHRNVLQKLSETFSDISVKIDGGTSVLYRKEVVEKFQNDPKIKLFLGNIKAAGVGITLHAASNVLFTELPFTPGEMVQSSDRVHRIGQKNAVGVHYLVAKNTIEEQILCLLQKKAEVLDQVIDGIDMEQSKESMGSVFTDLMKSMSK